MDNTKLLKSIEELLRKISQDIRAEMNARFDGVDARFDGVDQRLDGMDQRFDGMDQRFESLELKVEQYREQEKIEHEEIMEKLAESNDLNNSDLQKLGKRVSKIEDHLRLPHAQ